MDLTVQRCSVEHVAVCTTPSQVLSSRAQSDLLSAAQSALEPQQYELAEVSAQQKPLLQAVLHCADASHFSPSSRLGLHSPLPLLPLRSQYALDLQCWSTMQLVAHVGVMGRLLQTASA